MVDKKLIIGVAVIVLIISGFYIFNSGNDLTNSNKNIVNEDLDGNLDSNLKGNEKEVVNWREAELKDVVTGETFRISDFTGKPVLLESFAVWCPICTKQQGEIKKLHEELGDSVVSIGLDTDSSEDEKRVKSHAEKNGFNWRYVVSPIGVTQSLVDEFGTGIVNAPSAPIILICPDGRTSKLKSGVKSVEDLKTAINSC